MASQAPSPQRPPGKLPGRHLRQATLVVPTTGERVKRDFTLRNPDVYQNANPGASTSSETSPLLPVTNPSLQPASRFRRLRRWTRETSKDAWTNSVDFLASDVGHGIFKCSLAYFIATLATFSWPVAALLGSHQNGNQLVANVVVWFDPARSAGSMELAILLALLSFVYGAVVGLSSMGVSGFFAYHDLLVIGHISVVIVFVGGALGLLAWIKQHYGIPLVNVAASVASLAIVSVLTREGAVQEGTFSLYRITQVLKMLITGVVISSVVSLVFWPISARLKLRESLTKSTIAFGDVLAQLVGSFLSGLETDLTHPIILAADDRFKSVFSSLPTHLAESRYEHLLFGTEVRYGIEKRLVKCMQELAQDIGGLRSAAATQFTLLKEQGAVGQARRLQTRYSFDAQIRDVQQIRSDIGVDQATLMLESIEEMSETSSNDQKSPAQNVTGGPSPQKTAPQAPPQETVPQPPRAPADIFETFIQFLGPPMKSLGYTLQEILHNLPYEAKAGQAVPNIHIFRSSLADAVKLFSTSRREALELVYKSKDLSETKEVPIAADFEEVAASCGYFSSSLQDFAETCLKYLDILDELELEREERRSGRSWMWILFWRRTHTPDDDDSSSDPDIASAENALTRKMSRPSALAKAPIASDEKPVATMPFPYSLYPHLRFFRREDIQFAIKVGLGAAFYAMFAYIPATRPYYDHWRMEWGLAAYMMVCAMTIGASNSTSWSRLYGTLIGGALSIVIWMIAQENPYALSVIGWLVAVVCFYYILALNQAPMGRFVLLTYNLSILYSYALSIGDPDTGRPDEGHDKAPEIIYVVFHRVVAILMGCLTGIIVTRLIWPIKARRKLKYGLSLLWLRMGLIWKRGPLSVFNDDATNVPSYADLKQETKLREFVGTLDTVRKNAESEFHLRGPFPTDSFDALLKSTSRMLDGFHALSILIAKDTKASPGEAEILRYTAVERDQLAKRLSHQLSVLASSISMQYPLTDGLPDIGHTRDRLLAKVYEFRRGSSKKVVPLDEDYELLYAYALVTAQIGKEIEVSGKEIEKLYGALSEDVLQLQ